MNLFKSIDKAFKSLGKGIKTSFEGLGNAIGSAAKLDFKGFGKGIAQIGAGGLKAGQGLMNLNPSAIAANTLMNNAVDKVSGFVTDRASQVSAGALSRMAANLEAVKVGTLQATKGVAAAQPGQVVQGAVTAAQGASATARSFTPIGLAALAAQSAVEVARDNGLRQ